MKANIETKSPIHIGNGSKYGLMEAYVDNGYLVRVNLETVFSDNPEEVKLYTAAVAEKNPIIQKILKKGKERYRVELRGGKVEDAVNECIKDSAGDVPYIPGSSVKGFIRTALIAKYLKDNNWNFEISLMGSIAKYNIWDAMRNGIGEINVWKLMKDFREDYNKKRGRYKPKTLGNRFENLVVFIGELKSGNKGPYFKYDAKYDIFKFLQVSDFYPNDYEMWVDEIKVVSGRYGPSALYEVVMGKFEGAISLNPSIKAAITSKEYPLLRSKLSILGLEENDLDDLSRAEEKMLNHIKNALEEHMEEIKNYEIKNLHRQPKSYEGNIRLGFGTGFLYKTLWVYMVNNLPPNILHKILSALQYRGNPYYFPTSKHTLSSGEELGWAVLR